MIKSRLAETKIYHFYKELAIPGKEEYSIYQLAKDNPNATFIRYRNISDMSVSFQDGIKVIDFKDAIGYKGTITADMLILCPAVVPTDESGKLGMINDAPLDKR